MSETRRGAVILLQRGDPEISGAIAQGMLAARTETPRQLPREQVEIVEAEIEELGFDSFTVEDPFLVTNEEQLCEAVSCSNKISGAENTLELI